MMLLSRSLPSKDATESFTRTSTLRGEFFVTSSIDFENEKLPKIGMFSVRIDVRSAETYCKVLLFLQGG